MSIIIPANITFGPEHLFSYNLLQYDIYKKKVDIKNCYVPTYTYLNSPEVVQCRVK